MRDAIILSLAERLFICSRLLTAAAEKLSWDNSTVQELMNKLRQSVEKEIDLYAGIKEAE